jgi:hypothetical protein
MGFWQKELLIFGIAVIALLEKLYQKSEPS